jgi:hypothetical protein|tara:strand:+ start:887 stop:1108 length:222 start_codon:yes stop_codon:yes gene_type:complete
MKITEELQKSNPYVLTTMDGRPVFMNKHNPLYRTKPNDRIVSVDCVMANENRLIEITEELGLSPDQGVFELQA